MKSDLARLDELRDEDIDCTDIPELEDEVFAQPLVPGRRRRTLSGRDTVRPCPGPR